MSLKEDLAKAEYGTPFLCPEWKTGAALTIRAITGDEQEWFKTVYDAKASDPTPEQKEAHVNKMIAIFLGDADCKRIYSDEDIQLVKKLPELVKIRILRAGTALNSAGDFVEEKKSSPVIQTNNSGSSSVSPLASQTLINSNVA